MQSIALVADIHSNILALEAILKDIRRKHKPDRIISLGDQINLGPAPRKRSICSSRKTRLPAGKSRAICFIRYAA